MRGTTRRMRAAAPPRARAAARGRMRDSTRAVNSSAATIVLGAGDTEPLHGIDRAEEEAHMMPRHSVSVSATVRAPAAQVYAMLADYQVWHPAILPTRYFHNLAVERGGVGEGTVIRVRMRVLGTTRTFRAVVAEPEPGRVLVETDLDTGAVTTFTVGPTAGDAGTRVTITTALDVRPGVPGMLERLLTTVVLRRIYAQELALLARAHAAYAADIPHALEAQAAR